MGRVSSTIDLNADLGESFGPWSIGDDAAMLDVVTSANVACGFHAGDPLTLRRTCQVAAERGVTVGAQVGYRDLVGFGRRFLDMEPEELTAALAAHKANLDAQKTQAERDAARIAEMEPKAALADRLLESTKRRLATLEASLATHKARIDKLAPADSDPAARLEWLENAVAEGLFAAAAAPKPGSSRVVTPSGAPSASTEGGGKKPSEMTDAEYRAFKQRRFSEGPTQ